MGSSSERSQKVGVILDTNMLMLPSKMHINLEHEIARVVERAFEPVILDCILEELEKLRQTASPKTKREASFALALARKYKLIKVPDECRGKTVDETILKTAKKYKWCVATCDNKLRRELRKNGVPVIFLRQLSHFELEGTII